ncbi:hypothetical protein N7495_009914 [Penicillium taxi]|uniref:uncharacterized protein n=1 Tax=Penicillium taxi TaxID=168475 RepID=UPI00254573AC|nr:uncharacterized protein N7495_009914 [Penicillium taxi]KAJ5885404.1 hypothetical protein N7495_009914 [Penicillium taxi]
MRLAKRLAGAENEVPYRPLHHYKTFKPDEDTEAEWMTDSSISERPDIKPINPEGPESPYIRIAETDQELHAAIQLVSQSITQQRELAISAVMKHPVYWFSMLLVLNIIYTYNYHTVDLPVALIVWGGCFMLSLSVLRRIIQEYDTVADMTGRWAWLYGDEQLYKKSKTNESKKGKKCVKDPSRKSDSTWSLRSRSIVLVSFLNKEVIGTIVMRVEFRRDSVIPSIRAWTVKKKYRSHGIGSGILAYAVEMCRNLAWDSPIFAIDHANSVRVLPSPLNGWMDDMEQKACEKLRVEVEKQSAED